MKRNALFVGVNTYDDPTIRPLRFSIPDASVLADRFGRLGFSTRLLPDPTAAELLSAVEDCVSGLGPGDVFLFFFAGHGFTAQDGAHLLFCKNDRQRLLRVNGAGVRVDALEELTDGGGFHRAFLLDSCRTDCFAGAEARGAGTRDLDFIAMPASTASSGSFFLLRSCDKFRPALELDDLGHGLFTQGLLDAMDARDGRLALCDTSFAAAVSDRMEELQRRYHVLEPQRPSLGEVSGACFALFKDGFLEPPDNQGGARFRATASDELPAPLGGATSGRAARPEVLPHPEVAQHFSPAGESEVLRRKLSLSRDLKAISAADRADAEFAKFIAAAEDDMAVAEEAVRLDKFTAASESLDRVESALDDLRKARLEREMAERAAREKAETERKVRDEAERKAREAREAERKSREDAARRERAREEAERREKEESERLMREHDEAMRRVREESERLAREQEETEAKNDESHGLRIFMISLVLLAGVFLGIKLGVKGGASSPSEPPRTDGTSVPSNTGETTGVTNSPLSAVGQERDPPATSAARPEVSLQRAGEILSVTVGGVSFNLHYCPAGSFMMGSPSNEEGRDSDEKLHRVTLTKGFWMGETEVTQGLWKEVMGGNPSFFKSGDDSPVDNVSWTDCQEFIGRLNVHAEVRKAGLRFSLPTEAQWEYACRAGTTNAYGGTTGRLEDMGWYSSNSGSATHHVASKKANAWGLYDMHGNVWEWCQDWYGASYFITSAATDPRGPVSGTSRVLRGGGYWSTAQSCRSAIRFALGQGDRDQGFGLRLLALRDLFPASTWQSRRFIRF